MTPTKAANFLFTLVLLAVGYWLGWVIAVGGGR